MKKNVIIMAIVMLVVLAMTVFVGCAAMSLDSKINKIDNAKSFNGNITITKSGVADIGTLATIAAVGKAIADHAAENNYIYVPTGDGLKITGYEVKDPDKDNKVVFKGTIKFKEAKK